MSNSTEKLVGQLIIAGFRGKSIKDDSPIVKFIKDFNLAGVILYDIDLELGGKAPVIVYDDADIDQLIEGIRAFGYYNAGQDCTAACRIFADKNILHFYVFFYTKLII